MTPDNNANKEENLFTILVNKFLPYWPLFVILGIIFLALAWGYLRYATPAYQITASIIIKDQMKGVNDPSITESINTFDSNKIVENEIEVIQSRDLMRVVVHDLSLYAPVFEKKRLKSVPAYQSSPIIIKLKDPEAYTAPVKKDPKYYFAYDAASNQVKLNDNTYPLNKWVKTAAGEVKFVKNPNYTTRAEGDLYFKLVHPKVVTNDLLGRLVVTSASKNSSVINLELTDKAPKRGEDVLNKLIVVYNQAAINDKERLAANTLEFIESRIQTLESELESLENQILKYKTANNIVDLSEQGKVYLQNVGDNDRKMADINIQLAVLDKVESYVTAQDSASSIVPATLGVNDLVLSQLLKQLQEAESEYQRLRKTTAENNPAISSLASQITRTRRNILENIQNQRENLEASRTNIALTKQKYLAALQRIPIQERELLEISRQQATKRNVYNLLLEKREETALSYTPANLDTRVVELAEASVYPVSPKPLLAYFAALVMAFACGVAFVIGKGLLSNKITSRSQIAEFTDAPIVAEVSRVKEHQTDTFTAPADARLVEEFRQLRVSLGLYGKTINKKKVLVTSNIPGEGKSFISANLAYTLAASGKRVVLLDLDLRKPSVSQLFGQAGKKGITDYLTGDAELNDIINSTAYDHLCAIPAGTVTGDFSDLLLNGALDSMFAKLSSMFDYMVLDTPPLDLVTDGYLLSEYCDISLLVIRRSFTPKTVMKEFGQSNKQTALHNLAIVFNAVKHSRMAKGAYNYGYGRDKSQNIKPAYKRNFMKNSA